MERVVSDGLDSVSSGSSKPQAEKRRSLSDSPLSARVPIRGSDLVEALVALRREFFLRRRRHLVGDEI